MLLVMKPSIPSTCHRATFSDEERGKLLAYRDENRTVRLIAEEPQRSRTAVCHIINATKTASNSRKRRVKSTSSLRVGSCTQKWLLTGMFSVIQVSQMLQIEASRWNVRRAALKAEYLMWKRMRTA